MVIEPLTNSISRYCLLERRSYSGSGHHRIHTERLAAIKADRGQCLVTNRESLRRAITRARVQLAEAAMSQLRARVPPRRRAGTLRKAGVSPSERRCDRMTRPEMSPSHGRNMTMARAFPMSGRCASAWSANAGSSRLTKRGGVMESSAAPERVQTLFAQKENRPLFPM